MKQIIVLFLSIFVAVFAANSQYCKVSGNPDVNNILVKLASKPDGTTFAAGMEDSIGVVSKTDTSNNLIWSRRIFNERFPERKYNLTDIGIMRDSMLYGCGIIEVDSLPNPIGSFFFIMDQDSGYIHKFRRNESHGTVFKCMKYFNDKLFIAGGHFTSAARQAKVWCFNANSTNILWQTDEFSLTFPSYNEDSEEIFNGMTEVQNGRFFLTGRGKTQESLRGEDSRPIVVGLDTLGNIILHRYFLKQDNTSDLNFFEGVDICFDGSHQLLVAINGQEDYGVAVNNTDLYVLKITTSGANIYSKKYVSPELNNLKVKDISVINGKYFITGTAADDSTSGTMFAMYTNTNGQVTLAKNIRKDNGSMHTNYNYYNIGGGVTYAQGHIAIPMSMYFNGPEDSEYYFVRLNDTLFTLSSPCVLVKDLQITDQTYSTYGANLQLQQNAFSAPFYHGIKQSPHEFITEGCHFTDITYKKEEYGCDSTILTLGSMTDQPHEYYWLGMAQSDTRTFYEDSSFQIKIWNPARCCSLVVDYSLTLNRNAPQIFIPNDTLICQNDNNFSLDITSTIDFCWGCDIQWNTGETQNDISVDSSGLYRLNVTNNCNKTDIDSVLVKFQRYQQVDPIPDSIICEVQAPYLAQVNYPYADSIVWSNQTYGEQTQFQQAELADTEYLISYNECNVIRYDFQIEVLDIPVLANYADIDSCIDFGTALNIDLVADYATEIFINDFKQTQNSIQIGTDSTIEIRAENKCGIDQTTFDIDISNHPTYNFHPIIDTCIRENMPIDINVDVLAGDFLWFDGDSEPSRTFSGPGNYAFNVSNTCGSYDENIAITYKMFPREPLLSDIDTCLSEGVALYLEDKEPEDIRFLKNNRNDILINESIILTVRIGTECYSYLDTLDIKINRIPEIEVVKHMERCGTAAHAEALDVFSNFPYQVMDDNGIEISGEITESQHLTVYIDEYCGYVEDRGFIELGDAPQIFAPNAFTPDQDLFNNVYTIGGENFELLGAKIFNRYGQMIFSQDNGFDGWDGSFNGKICPTGIYVIEYEYISCGEEAKTARQTVTLLK